MTLAKNKVINIDRYFASEVPEAELDTAEPSPAAPDSKVKGIQPYQPDNYSEYLVQTIQQTRLELNSETTDSSAPKLSEEGFTEKLNKLLQADNSYLFDPLPVDLAPPTATAKPASERKSGFGLGSVAQAVLIMVLSSIGLKFVTTANFPCDRYQVCQTSRALIQQAQTQVKSTSTKLYVTVLNRPDEGQPLFQNGLEQAYAAALLVQTASTPAEWEQAYELWQEAIDFMKAIPASSEAYTDAQTRLSVYQYHQNYALAEVDSFREAVNAAMDAAQAIQSASSAQDYQKVSQQWIEAIQLMEGVTTESQYYGTAQRKIAEYAKNLSYSQGLSVVNYDLQPHQPADK